MKRKTEVSRSAERFAEIVPGSDYHWIRYTKRHLSKAECIQAMFDGNADPKYIFLTMDIIYVQNIRPKIVGIRL